MERFEEGNLRGAQVVFELNGKEIWGVVITHTRGSRWLIQAPKLPRSYWRWDGTRRIVLERDAFIVAW